MPTTSRRHDLDWLRVGVFMLLILYHVGMFYGPWGWHVKSAHAPVAGFEAPMRLLNPWRLSLLFLISGVALRFAMDKAAHGAFARRRAWRLGAPVLFGMIVVCAPQAWYELAQSGRLDRGLWAFYLAYLTPPWASPASWTPTITPTWNHLWYLIYLLLHSLAIIGLSAITGRRLGPVLTRGADALARWPAGVGLTVLPLALMILLVPLLHSYGRMQTLWGDWYNVCATFTIMLAGYGLATSAPMWSRIEAARWIALGMALLASAIMLADSLPSYPAIALRITQGWCVIVALLGFARRWLNRPSPKLSYLSDAVFTWYVVHQTLIIVIGMPLSGLGLPLGWEVLTLSAATLLGCAVIYHYLVRHMGHWAVLLGGRGPVSAQTSQVRAP